MAEIYGWNPQKIVDDGQERFRQKMKERVKGVHEATLQALFEQAKRSVRQHRAPAEREVLEQRVRQLWADYTRHESRKAEIAEQMGELFKQLNRKGKAPDRVGGLDAVMMARLLAESGPLSDHVPTTVGVRPLAGGAALLRAEPLRAGKRDLQGRDQNLEERPISVPEGIGVVSR